MLEAVDYLHNNEDFFMRDNDAMTTFEFPRLATVGGDLYIDSNELLTTFYLPVIDAVGTAGTGGT